MVAGLVVNRCVAAAPSTTNSRMEAPVVGVVRGRPLGRIPTDSPVLVAPPAPAPHHGRMSLANIPARCGGLVRPARLWAVGVAVACLCLCASVSAQDLDVDGDGFCPSGQDFNLDGDCLDEGEMQGNGDCDEDDPLVNPGARELCADERDNDCDGLTDLEDPNCGVVLDDDGDGYCPRGIDLDQNGDCVGDGEGVEPFDCDDTRPHVRPGLPEVCNDTLDNDCDGGFDDEDDECGSYRDLDGDGFCPVGRDINRDRDCSDADEEGAMRDCDDSRADVSPLRDEVCDFQGLDEDCDGAADADDDACRDLVDRDGDGYCPNGRDFDADAVCFSPGEAGFAQDCDDDAPLRSPGLTEACGDGLDNDCDDLVDSDDDACAAGVDRDGDGFCPRGTDLDADGDCFGEDELAMGRDCDEADPARNSGALEVCGDGVDNDCDDATDRFDGDCTSRVDGDGDGYCPDGVDRDRDGECFDPDERSDVLNDCDDNVRALSPGAAEDCGDGIDNDCDRDTDGADDECEGRIDNDGDGFCADGVDVDSDGVCAGDELDGPRDCDDTDASVSPDAAEDCHDEVDNDCDEDTDRRDLDCPASGFDADGDGYCPQGRDLDQNGDCLGPDEAGQGADCDDRDAEIHPAALELCTGGEDEDCDGRVDQADDACPRALLDLDGDGFCPGAPDLDGDGDCLDDGESGEGDCDDGDPRVHPAADELCNEIDDNCSGEADEGACDEVVDVVRPRPTQPAGGCGAATRSLPDFPAFPALRRR